MDAVPPDPGVSEHARLDVDPFDLLVAKRRVDGLHAALAKLNERDADVVRRRAGLGRPPQTLKQVGDDLGLTSERVRQIQLRAYARLKVLLTPPSPAAEPRLRATYPPPELLKPPPPPKRRPGPAPRYLHPKRSPGTQPLGLHHYYPDGLTGCIEDRKRREVRVRVCRSLKQPTNPIRRYIVRVFEACHAEGLTTLDGDELHDFFRWRGNDLPLMDLAAVVYELVRRGTLRSDLSVPFTGSLHQWFGAADFALWVRDLKGAGLRML